ncbi:MAG TPA: DUF5668 domain-containing protein [Patescibacteria group bacterium]
MVTLILGLIITALGLSYLGTNLGLWASFNWMNVWALWPLILILIGVRLLVRSNRLFALGAFIILGLALRMLILAGDHPLMQSGFGSGVWDCQWANHLPDISRMHRLQLH